MDKDRHKAALCSIEYAISVVRTEAKERAMILDDRTTGIIACMLHDPSMGLAFDYLEDPTVLDGAQQRAREIRDPADLFR